MNLFCLYKNVKALKKKRRKKCNKKHRAEEATVIKKQDKNM